MTARRTARVFTIHPGAPFLPTLVTALREGRLIPGFEPGADPLALAGATIFVPTRRAARELRAALAATSGARSAILPTIKALGEFDDGEAAFAESGTDILSTSAPIAAVDRLLLLAPLVQRWKERLPERLAGLFAEKVVIPASTADSIWLARDLAALMDEVELEGTSWSKLGSLVSDDLASWWQVTLDFLDIVTRQWPAILETMGRSNPASYRDTLLRAEAERLTRLPPSGPVIAAGSTGSIPGTAELLKAIASLPNGAVVLPGLDRTMDDASWRQVTEPDPEATVFGHPQFGLARLMAKLGVLRDDVEELGKADTLAVDRAWIVSEAMRPAEATDGWLAARTILDEERKASALSNITLIESSNERDEAAAIAVAMRRAMDQEHATAALVTADRDLARRVSSELRRFGIVADDSGGTPLATTPPAVLLRMLLAAAFSEPDPVRMLSLIKHPLLLLGLPRRQVREAGETIELVALRGGVGRPTLQTLSSHFDARWNALRDDHRNANWFDRIDSSRLARARDVLARLERILAPLFALAASGRTNLSEIAAASVAAFEALGRDETGTTTPLYDGDAGQSLVEFLQGLVSTVAPFSLSPREWPAVFDALLGAEAVKPRVLDDSRISIWGTLEARLQTVDTLVLGELNEGNWPRKVRGGRFLSRIMRGGMDLEPPEREIGLAAHDFQMAMGNARVILSRSGRAGEAPAVPSRWLQRLTAFVGEKHTEIMRKRGDELIRMARDLDYANTPSAPRAQYAPPLEVRPKSFSVTEIETLRRDPYAVYARRILKLRPIEPLIRDPSVAERGTLFHLILHEFKLAGIIAAAPEAEAQLLSIGERVFDAHHLPDDVRAVWWPRFVRTARNFIQFEKQRESGARAFTEVRARPQEIPGLGVTLSGYADRIDVKADGRADIIDYKTGSSPSTRQAHTLISPQLPLEAALMKRGAFEAIGQREPADLLYVRLRANGEVKPDTILEYNRKIVPADELAERAWQRLEDLLAYFADPANAYRSRVLPFKESDMDGDYDHLARVMEWSAGAEEEDEFGSGGA